MKRALIVVAVVAALAANAVGERASADSAPSYINTLRHAAAQLRLAARQRSGSVEIKLPPAPLPGPPRLSPSLDDWLQAGLIRTSHEKGKNRSRDLQRLSDSLDLVASELTASAAKPPVTEPAAAARAILADPSYQSAQIATKAPEKTWLERFQEWLVRMFERVFGGTARAAMRVPALGEIIGIAILAAAALGLAWVIYQLVRNYMLGRPRRQIESEGEVIGPGQSASALVAAAREAAAQGRYARAIALLFQASLVALDRAGIVSYDAARTAGEYRRTVKRVRAGLYGPFDKLATAFVIAAYAERPAHEGEWRDAHDAYHAFEGSVSR